MPFNKRVYAEPITYQQPTRNIPPHDPRIERYCIKCHVVRPLCEYRINKKKPIWTVNKQCNRCNPLTKKQVSSMQDLISMQGNGLRG